MNTKKTCELPRKLENVRQRIERWRRTRKARLPIPEPLWAAAVKMASTYGVNRTAEALRVNYYALKKRVEQKTSAVDDAPRAIAGVRFIELVPPDAAGPCLCTLELENTGGAKMRIQLKSVEMPDLAAVSRSFWNLES
jgi:hypothetical protein